MEKLKGTEMIDDELIEKCQEYVDKENLFRSVKQ